MNTHYQDIITIEPGKRGTSPAQRPEKHLAFKRGDERLPYIRLQKNRAITMYMFYAQTLTYITHYANYHHPITN